MQRASRPLAPYRGSARTGTTGILPVASAQVKPITSPSAAPLVQHASLLRHNQRRMRVFDSFLAAMHELELRPPFRQTDLLYTNGV